MDWSADLYINAQGLAIAPRAWVDYHGVRYVAEAQTGRFYPETPVTRLIDGIYSERPGEALWILRQRIHTSYPATDLCRSAVAVAAKRLAPLSNWQPSPPEIFECRPYRSTGPQNCSPRSGDSAPGTTDEAWLQRAAALAATIPVESQLYRSHRQVAAIAVAADGQEIGRATNTNASNKMYHAEMNLLWDLAKRRRAPIQSGTKIFVTLKPCRMCAAAIVHCADDPNGLCVIYANEDTGPHSKNTKLDALGVIRRHTPVFMGHGSTS